LAVMMLDGIELRDRTNIVALGISTEGDKPSLGLWDGSSENATVAAALLADLVDAAVAVDGARGPSFMANAHGMGRSAGPTCRVGASVCRRGQTPRTGHRGSDPYAWSANRAVAPGPRSS